MKKAIYSIGVIFLVGAICFMCKISPKGLKSHDKVRNSIMVIDSITCDFGKVQIDEKKIREVKFQNSGSYPLLIYSVVTNCGCISATWPDQPIMPGDKGTIVLSFESKTPTLFRKLVKVYANIEKRSVDLYVKGEVPQ